MPKNYEQALGGINYVAQVTFNDLPPQGSPGRAFVWSCRRQNILPQNNMAQVNTRFHQWLVGRNWQWDPDVGGNSTPHGARLLDGTVPNNRGECGYPAHALAYLINAPQPYGFGVGGATVETHEGLHDEGFISAHANVLGVPQSNIIQTQGNALPGFYYWGNHKVVLFNGQYYDPNYNAVYNALTDMEVASLQVVRLNVRLRDLENYNPLSPWGFLLGWGLPRLALLKLSDFIWGNTHGITVTQAVNVTNVAVNGHYIEWTQDWVLPGHRNRRLKYGPFSQNPLIR